MVVLRHIANACVQTHNLLTSIQYMPGGWCIHACCHVQQRRLATARGSDQRHNLALVHAQVNAFDCGVPYTIDIKTFLDSEKLHHRAM